MYIAAAMVPVFQELNAIHVLQFGVKMEAVLALIIKSKQAELTAQLAKAAVKVKSYILDRFYGNNKRHFTRRSCMEGSQEI